MRASKSTTTLTCAGGFTGEAPASPVRLVWAVSAMAMRASKSIASELSRLPALRLASNTASRNGWKWARNVDPSRTVPRSDPVKAPSLSRPVRKHRSAWMRAWVASSSGSAAALARPQRSLRPWSGSVLAVSNRAIGGRRVRRGGVDDQGGLFLGQLPVPQRRLDLRLVGDLLGRGQQIGGLALRGPRTAGQPIRRVTAALGPRWPDRPTTP